MPMFDEDSFPLIPHSSTGARCRGYIVATATGNDVELACNECGAVVGVMQADILVDLVRLVK